MTRPVKKTDTPPQRLVRIGGREIMTRGLDRNPWGDFYHHSMTVSWPRFFAGYALVFLGMNCVFAAFYAVGADPIANARPGTADLVFFSIETLATVGYGDMHPQTTYAHVIATAEIFFGLSMLAVVTGLVFQRFARPRARILFARNPVMVRHESFPTFMLRLANERHNNISDARAKLWVLRDEISDEGLRFRRFHELPIERGESPVFALSWTIFHRVDETSRLWQQTPEDIAGCNAQFLVAITGHDETSGQDVHVRHVYLAEDLLWNRRYVDILTTEDDGRLHIDYTRFHDTEPSPIQLG